MKEAIGSSSSGGDDALVLRMKSNGGGRSDITWLSVLGDFPDDWNLTYFGQLKMILGDLAMRLTAVCMLGYSSY